jgi:hypothetical protein
LYLTDGTQNACVVSCVRRVTSTVAFAGTWRIGGRFGVVRSTTLGTDG